MGNELKPCPFCGGEAKLMKMDYEGGEVWGVFCKDDLAAEYSHGHYIDNYMTAESAIAAWNRRADDRIHCRDCRYYIEDKMPIDPDWPMMCYETGRDMLEPWGWCAWAERREDVDDRDR